MFRHSIRFSYTLGLSKALRFGAVAASLLATIACSANDRGLFSDAQNSPGAGGTSGSGSLGGKGGFAFFEELENMGGAGNGGSENVPGDAGVAGAGALQPYVLPPDVTVNEAGEVLCGSSPCACNNGVDDDADGKSDGFDEECTGALDDDEGTFSTGIPGDNSDPKWQDCFFDGNSGAGDDHCRYHADCLTGDKPVSDSDCAVSAECHDFCAARTPNGCDCFGCCTVRLNDTSSVSVFIGESCELGSVDDPARCARCTPSTACGNECGECELCAGKTIADLPASCSTTPGGAGGGGGDTPTHRCDDGLSVCNGTSDCPAGHYCSLGCCLAFVIH